MRLMGGAVENKSDTFTDTLTFMWSEVDTPTCTLYADLGIAYFDQEIVGLLCYAQKPRLTLNEQSEVP